MKKSMGMVVIMCTSLVANSQGLKTKTVINGLGVFDSRNNKSDVSIYFGESQENYCNIAVPRESIKTGYSVISKKKSTSTIKAGCQWDGKTYSRSSENPTYAILRVDEINSEIGISTFTVSLKLINKESNNYFILDNREFGFNKKHTERLIKSENEINEAHQQDHINKLQNLYSITAEIITQYNRFPNLNFAHFAEYKKQKERELEPICKYLGELKSKTGNMNSPYFEVFGQCRTVTLSMMTVLFDIRDKDRQSIEKQINKLKDIEKSLVKAVENI